MDNAARAYEYEEELTAIRPEGDFIPASKSVENVVLKEIKLKQERKKVKNRILVKVSCLIALGLVVAFRYASITEINYENQELMQQYSELQDDIQEKQVAMDSRMSILDISRIAQDKLNMQKPQPYQIVYIQTETIDQTEIATGEYTKDETDLPWYESAWHSVMEFFGLMQA